MSLFKTKMIYHGHDKRRRRRKSIVITGWIIAFVLVVGLLSFFAPHLFSGFAITIARPFMGSREAATASVDSIFTIFSSKQQLAQENTDLKNQLVLYNAVKTERDHLQQENSDLQKMLGKVSPKHSVVLGQILSKPGFSPYDTVIVNSGSANGIAVGNQVLADDATVIGLVSAVTLNTSTITLYSSPDQKIDVFVGSSTLQTTAIGKGGGNFQLRLPKNTSVAEGDDVTLASDPEKILGTVGVIDATPTDSFEDILFKSSVDVNHLKFLLIETK